MVNIDFGTLVAVVLEELSFSENELGVDEWKDPHAALMIYKRNTAAVIRKLFDEVELAEGDEEPVCPACGMPVISEAVVQRLADTLGEDAAKDAGMSQDDPLLREAIARVREDYPEEWTALVQKIITRAAA